MTLKIVIALDYNCSVFSCEIAWTFLCLYISKHSAYLVSQRAFCFQRSVLPIHGDRGTHAQAHHLSSFTQDLHLLGVCSLSDQGSLLFPYRGNLAITNNYVQ